MYKRCSFIWLKTFLTSSKLVALRNKMTHHWTRVLLDMMQEYVETYLDANADLWGFRSMKIMYVIPFILQFKIISVFRSCCVLSITLMTVWKKLWISTWLDIFFQGFRVQELAILILWLKVLLTGTGTL